MNPGVFKGSPNCKESKENMEGPKDTAQPHSDVGGSTCQKETDQTGHYTSLEDSSEGSS